LAQAREIFEEEDGASLMMTNDAGKKVFRKNSSLFPPTARPVLT